MIKKICVAYNDKIIGEAFSKEIQRKCIDVNSYYVGKKRFSKEIELLRPDFLIFNVDDPDTKEILSQFKKDWFLKTSSVLLGITQRSSVADISLFNEYCFKYIGFSSDIESFINNTLVLMNDISVSLLDRPKYVHQKTFPLYELCSIEEIGLNKIKIKTFCSNLYEGQVLNSLFIDKTLKPISSIKVDKFTLNSETVKHNTIEVELDHKIINFQKKQSAHKEIISSFISKNSHNAETTISVLMLDRNGDILNLDKIKCKQENVFLVNNPTEFAQQIKLTLPDVIIFEFASGEDNLNKKITWKINSIIEDEIKPAILDGDHYNPDIIFFNANSSYNDKNYFFKSKIDIIEINKILSVKAAKNNIYIPQSILPSDCVLLNFGDASLHSLSSQAMSFSSSFYFYSDATFFTTAPAPMILKQLNSKIIKEKMNTTVTMIPLSEKDISVIKKTLRRI